MFTSAITALCLAAAQGATIWINAADWQGGSITVPEAGTYQIWGWAPATLSGDVALGEAQHTLAPPEQQEAPYVWAQIAQQALAAGEVAVTAPDGLATLVLTTEAGYQPAQALENRNVLDTPERIVDQRADKAHHTNTVFTMPEFASLGAWEEQAELLRRRLLISCGLTPLPARTPLNAKVFDKISHADYTIEKVHFEAWPGYLVTGNLYRPVGEGPFPAVIMPHGHWSAGRLADDERGSVPARCITFARMGMVAFSYDMIGYVDSFQCSHGWNSEANKLWGVHPFALQLWASVRAIDFVQGLTGVDPRRIGCTGASGGGTQTFAVTAIDPRIKVSAPVNMISSTMQGGCVCENAPIIRMGNSNMEIGALGAPRPLMMVSATGDWTRETPRVEYPAIRSIYALYDATDRIAERQVDAGHNYNQLSREAVYQFFGKHLLQQEGWDTFKEPAYTLEADADVRVFSDGEIAELRKTYGDEEAVVQSIVAAVREKWNAVLPETRTEAEAFQARYSPVIGDTLGLQIPEGARIQPERAGIVWHDDYILERWIVRNPEAGAAIPALLYRPRNNAVVPTVLVVHGDGKAALANNTDGTPGDLVAGLLAQGKAVLAIDAFLLGEHHSPYGRTKRYTEGPFMDTFQPTDTGYRVQDILTAITFLQGRRDLSDAVSVVGLGEGGVWAALATAADGRIQRCIADLNGFNRQDDGEWVARHYIPCIRSVGDLATAAALTMPRSLVLANASPSDTTTYLGAQMHDGALATAAILDYLK